MGHLVIKGDQGDLILEQVAQMGYGVSIVKTQLDITLNNLLWCSISEGTKGTEGNVPLLSILVFGIVTDWNRDNYKGLD
ncbi:hypothetical protein BTVI_103408 [Pitangus sulphuratus]|nr:hypothetical protein BTVI_103408 [Pitangus sulphuratus]